MLSALEKNFIFSTIEKCRYSSSAEHLEELLAYFVGGFIPHKSALCEIGHVDSTMPMRRIEFGGASGVVGDVSATFFMNDNFLLPLWMQRRAPLYAAIADLDDSRLTQDQKEWRDSLMGDGVRNVAMHGVLDAGRGIAGFFFLGALTEPLTEHQAEIFSILIPHLHHALCKVVQLDSAISMKGEENAGRAVAAPVQSRPVAERVRWGLTRREAEILKWIYYGKTNSETARILGISELTVRNHMQNLMLKLGVGNRTQAVVKAMQNNIFSDQGAALSNPV